MATPSPGEKSFSTEELETHSSKLKKASRALPAENVAALGSHIHLRRQSGQ